MCAHCRIMAKTIKLPLHLLRCHVSHYLVCASESQQALNYSLQLMIFWHGNVYYINTPGLHLDALTIAINCSLRVALVYMDDTYKDNSNLRLLKFHTSPIILPFKVYSNRKILTLSDNDTLDWLPVRLLVTLWTGRSFIDNNAQLNV